MKRDWDVIREVLLEVEALSDDEKDGFVYKQGDGDIKTEHAILLWRAGYIGAIDGADLDGIGLVSPELTWAGHDLLDTLRSKPVWERIKSTAKEKGIELTFDAVKALGQMALDYVLKGG